MNLNPDNHFKQLTTPTRGAKTAKVASPQNQKNLVISRSKRQLPLGAWPTFGILERGVKVVQKSRRRKQLCRNDFEFRRAGLLNQPWRRSPLRRSSTGNWRECRGA